MGMQKLKKGLTWRSLISMLIAGVLFLPVSAFCILTLGSTAIVSVASFVLIIVIGGMSRYFGRPLTKQEIFIMYSSIGYVIGSIGPYYWLIWRAFYISTPTFAEIKLMGKSLIDFVPDWMAPKSLDIINQRTFLMGGWLIPISIALVMSFAGFLQYLSLGMFFSQLFVEVERLEFPMAQVQSAIIEVISEAKERVYEIKRMRYFTFSLLAGFFIGTVFYVPLVIGRPLIPFPFIDLTSFTTDFVPGAIIGIASDPSVFIGAMPIPLHVVFYALISSIIVWIILNNVFLVSLPDIFPKWVEDFYRGMTIPTLQYRSYLRIWLPIQFGLTLGMAIAFTISLRKEIIKSFKLFSRIETKSELPLSPIANLALFLGSSLLSVTIFLFLTPGYPLLVAYSLSLGYSFLAALISSRALGIGGVAPSITWPWRIITSLTDYKGFVAWDFSPAIEMGGSSSIVQSVKVSYLTETKPVDLIKSLILATAISVPISLLAFDFFWRMAPIPSIVYPHTLLYWPQYVLELIMFAAGEIKINPEIIVLSLMSGAAFPFIEGLFRKFGLIFSSIGIIIGVFTIPPYTISMFIGSLLSNIIIPRFLPEWKDFRFIFISGLFGGMSLVTSISLGLSLLARAAWIWPW
jgi:hypothetical protein